MLDFVEMESWKNRVLSGRKKFNFRFLKFNIAMGNSKKNIPEARISKHFSFLEKSQTGKYFSLCRSDTVFVTCSL